MKYFTDVCLKIVEKREEPKNFDKVKFLKKENYCSRCKYNIPEHCSSTEEYQQILK